jgi:hypothetical protein
MNLTAMSRHIRRKALTPSPSVSLMTANSRAQDVPASTWIKAFKRIFKRISAALIMDLGQVDKSWRTSRRTMLRHAPTKGSLIWMGCDYGHSHTTSNMMRMSSIPPG